MTLHLAKAEGVLYAWAFEPAPINHYTFWGVALPDGQTLTNDPEAFAALPTELTIYRGSGSPDAAINGFSWTLDRTIAEKFARLTTISIGSSAMVPRKELGFVAAMNIYKSEISLYLTGREEAEVVIHPDYWPSPETLTDLSQVEPEGSAS